MVDAGHSNLPFSLKFCPYNNLDFLVTRHVCGQRYFKQAKYAFHKLDRKFSQLKFEILFGTIT